MAPAQHRAGLLVEQVTVHALRSELGGVRLQRAAFAFDAGEFRLQHGDLDIETAAGVETTISMYGMVAEIRYGACRHQPEGDVENSGAEAAARYHAYTIALT